MPWTLSEYDDPAAGVQDVLTNAVAGLVDAGVSAADIGRFRVDVLPSGFSGDDYQASSDRVWREPTIYKNEQGVEFTGAVEWYSQHHCYSGVVLHDYVAGPGDGPPKVTAKQMLDCRIVAACWAWNTSTPAVQRAVTCYLESLMFALVLPAIEAQGVSKSQRKRAKAPRKDEYKAIDWAEHARVDIARAMRRKADRGESMKVIAPNNKLSVRYVSKLATEMGWTGKKGRPKKPTK